MDDTYGTNVVKVAAVNSTDEDLGMTPETGHVYVSGTLAHGHPENSMLTDCANSTTV